MMNINKTTKLVLVIALFGLFVQSTTAQTGLAITAGIGMAKNQLTEVSGGYGAGYTGAVEARFLGQDMYFDIQLGYGRYKLVTKSGVEFATSDNNLQVIHGRIGMGFTLWRISEKVLLRAKVLGSLDQNYLYTSDILKDIVSAKMNNATFGMVGGLGLDFHRIVIDFEYEKGLINTFFEIPESNVNYIGLRAGILIN